MELGNSVRLLEFLETCAYTDKHRLKKYIYTFGGQQSHIIALNIGRNHPQELEVRQYLLLVFRALELDRVANYLELDRVADYLFQLTLR